MERIVLDIPTTTILSISLKCTDEEEMSQEADDYWILNKTIVPIVHNPTSELQRDKVSKFWDNKMWI